MKNILFTILILIPVTIIGGELDLKHYKSIKKERSIVMLPEVSVSPDKEWYNLVMAIHWVESSNGKRIVGDGSKAVGPLQIHKGMVDLVNKIQSEYHFSYKDRSSFNKSLLMFEIFQDKYNPSRNIEIAAKIWNGGSRSKYPDYSTPKAARRTKNVEKYWSLINKRMHFTSNN